jgi:diguanylate cyclase (GGDEF)-like protein
MQKILSSLLLPNGLLLLAAVVFLQLRSFSQSLLALVQIYPYAVLGIGVFLGWRFRRSWLAFAILAIVLADRALLLHDAARHAAWGHARLLVDAMAIVLPLILAILSFASVRERRLVTSRIRLGLGLIFFELLVLLICYRESTHPGSIPQHYLGGGSFVDWIPIARSGLLAFGLVFLLFAIRFIRHRTSIDSGFFWALIAVFLALSVKEVGNISTFYLSTAGLILVVSMVETSYRLAYHDELTGLPGRRALNEALLRLREKYTVAMVDVDHFKRFNDQYGHEVGDQVLRMVAANLERMLGGGKAFRYGGEEFVVLFAGKSISNTIPLLEALRKAIGASDFTLRGKDRPREKPDAPKPAAAPRKKVSVTVSIGIAERTARHTQPDQVVRAADRALYRAKEAGRNRVSA